MTGEPPTYTRATKSGKSAVVTVEQIIDVAVRICDTAGIDALTVRLLASELHIGTMTLYSYFRGKDAILDGIADRILGQLTLPAMTGQSPAGAARSIAISFIAMMHDHPSVVYLLSKRTTTSKRSLQAAMDQVIGALRTAGFSRIGAVRAYALLLTYCLGFASYQIPRPWGLDTTDGVEELRRQRRHFYSSLPLPEFQNVVELSELVTTMPADAQFEFGLDCLIYGLTAQPGILETPTRSSTGSDARSTKASPRRRSSSVARPGSA